MAISDVRMNRITLTVLLALGLVVTIYILSKVRSAGSELYSEDVIRLSELISASIDLAERGGRRVVEVRNMDDSEIGQLSKGMTKEGKSEYVTIGDKESHQIIVSGLKAAWPSLAVQSEESDAIPSVDIPLPSRFNSEVSSMASRDEVIPSREVTVWVDPLDATQEYTEGGEDKDLLKYVTVMVCIAVSGHPIAGIIHQPFQGVTKWGWVGHGLSYSIKNARKEKSSTDKMQVIYSRSHAGEVSRIAQAAFPGPLEEIVAAGSGYKVLQVVERKADVYLHTTAIKKWDICAGDAVLNAAGGEMTTIAGKTIDYSFAGSPRNEDGIVAALPSFMQRTYVDMLNRQQSH